MASGTIITERCVKEIFITSTGGYISEASKTAIRNVYADLPDNSICMGVLSAGSTAALLFMKANNNYGVVTSFSYGGSNAAKVAIRSMTLYGGTWGDWVVAN